MQNLKSLVIGLMLTVPILTGSSCNNLPLITQTVSGGTYLYVEYNSMVKQVRKLPFNAEQRELLIGINDELDEMRLEIGGIFQKEGIDVLISVLRATDYVNRIGMLYARASAVIRSMYKDLGQPVPADMEMFDASAQQAYIGMKQLLIAAQEQVRLNTIGLYLKAGMKIYVAAKYGAAGAVFEQSI